MNNVTDLDTYRPHDTELITCKGCGHSWQAVFPTGTAALECPGCHNAVNEYGTRVSRHVCEDCGRPFTLCPASDTFGNKCLADDCISYDPARDAEILMGFKDEPEIH